MDEFQQQLGQATLVLQFQTVGHIYEMHGGRSNSEVRRGTILFHGEGDPIAALCHLFEPSDPNIGPWIILSVLRSNIKLLQIIGCAANNEFPGKTVIFTEPAVTTLEAWLTGNKFIINSPSELNLCNFTGILRKYLKEVLDAILAIIYSGTTVIYHGNISTKNIYIDCSETAKLGRFNISTPDQLDDITGFTDMVRNLNYPRRGGASQIPDELNYFYLCMTSQGPPEYGLWNAINRINSPNHPQWMSDLERVNYREAIGNAVVAMEQSNDKSLYNEVRKQVQDRLDFYGLGSFDWIARVKSISAARDPDRAAFKTLIFKHGIDYENEYANSNSLVFARYCRNYKIHRQSRINCWTTAEQHFTYFYPGYLPIIHEVLTGIRIFIHLPPYGGFTSRFALQ